jgi:hypothetical protein
MQRRNIDVEILRTRELWDQFGQAANLRPDFSVVRWSPAEPDFIRLSSREDDRPDGWNATTPPLDDMPRGS